MLLSAAGGVSERWSLSVSVVVARYQPSAAGFGKRRRQVFRSRASVSIRAQSTSAAYYAQY
jgi:hypothetical protein